MLGASDPLARSLSPEPDSPSSSHHPQSSAPAEEPDTTLAPHPQHDEPIVATKKTRSKAGGTGKKATVDATQGDGTAAEPVPRKGTRRRTTNRA